jgi:hypothetical protein
VGAGRWGWLEGHRIGVAAAGRMLVVGCNMLFFE